MYSKLLQNCRGGSTLKEKFSSSRCQRDKNYLFVGSLPPDSCRGVPSKKSSRRLVAHETKRYFFESILLGVHHQKKSSRRLVANETKRYFCEGNLFDSLHTILIIHLLWFIRILPQKIL